VLKPNSVEELNSLTGDVTSAITCLRNWELIIF